MSMNKDSIDTTEGSFSQAVEEYKEAREDGSWEEPVLVALSDRSGYITFESGPRKYFRKTWLEKVKSWDIERDLVGVLDSDDTLEDIREELLADVLEERAYWRCHS